MSGLNGECANLDAGSGHNIIIDSREIRSWCTCKTNIGLAFYCDLSTRILTISPVIKDSKVDTVTIRLFGKLEGDNCFLQNIYTLRSYIPFEVQLQIFLINFNFF